MASKAALRRAYEYSYTAERVLATLEAVVLAPSTVSDVADVIGADPRTARRILRTLERAGYVERFALGGRGAHHQASIRLLAMAAQLAPRLPFVQHGREAVHRLEAAGDHAAYVAVPSYGELLVIACSGARGISPWTLVPALGDAAGRVLLAHRDEWRESVVSDPRNLRAADVTRTREARRRIVSLGRHRRRHARGRCAAGGGLADRGDWAAWTERCPCR